MTDFYAQARKAMVDGQIRVHDVTRASVREALLTVPRETFLPAAFHSSAYAEQRVSFPLPQGERFLFTPLVLSKLLNAAQIESPHHVLLIGGGWGYTAAVFSQLAHHVTVQEHPALAEEAAKRLSEKGIPNVTVSGGRLEEGNAANGPYDVIFVEGAMASLPSSLLKQLKEKTGRLATIWHSEGRSEGTLITHLNGSPTFRPLFDASAPLLPEFQREKGFVF